MEIVIKCWILENAVIVISLFVLKNVYIKFQKITYILLWNA